MSRKARYTVKAKMQAAERYLRGEASAAAIAEEIKMGKCGERRVREWAAVYQENGIEGFHRHCPKQKSEKMPIAGIRSA